MNPIWSSIVLRTSLRHKKNLNREKISNYELAKGLRAFQTTTFEIIKDLFLITIGIFSAAFGFKGFLLTNQFIDGGATGISLLLTNIFSIPLYQFIIAVNVPFIILGYNIIGKTFALKTTIAIAGLALVLATVTFPNVTNDNLLVAVFGGFFLGAGIGLAVRGGAVIDGTEVLAIYLSRKIGTTMGDIIIIINVIIFSVAAYFLSIEIALYSMITYLSASKTLDFIVDGIEEYTGVTIISVHSDDIRNMIIHRMGRGVTIYEGKNGYGKRGELREIEIIYTVVTRLELNKLNAEIKMIDRYAFVVTSAVKDTHGGMIKKRPLQH
ncbi:YitT family protein [soil metagenome]